MLPSVARIEAETAQLVLTWTKVLTNRRICIHFVQLTASRREPTAFGSARSESRAAESAGGGGQAAACRLRAAKDRASVTPTLLRERSRPALTQTAVSLLLLLLELLVACPACEMDQPQVVSDSISI